MENRIILTKCDNGSMGLMTEGKWNDVEVFNYTFSAALGLMMELGEEGPVPASVIGHNMIEHIKKAIGEGEEDVRN